MTGVQPEMLSEEAPPFMLPLRWLFKEHPASPGRVILTSGGHLIINPNHVPTPGPATIDDAAGSGKSRQSDANGIWTPLLGPSRKRKRAGCEETDGALDKPDTGWAESGNDEPCSLPDDNWNTKILHLPASTHVMPNKENNLYNSSCHGLSPAKTSGEGMINGNQTEIPRNPCQLEQSGLMGWPGTESKEMSASADTAELEYAPLGCWDANSDWVCASMDQIFQTEPLDVDILALS